MMRTSLAFTTIKSDDQGNCRIQQSLLKNDIGFAFTLAAGLHDIEKRQLARPVKN